MPEQAIEEFRVAHEPYYLPVSREVELFEAAHTSRLPVILKGPTGCGKTRFVEYMAWRLERPLITVACHEDLSSTDLVGRFLLEGQETIWHDGPLTSAVRNGAICYLDEVVEARKDTVVIIHPLTDHRRRLPIEKRGTILDAPPDFMLVVSYNPGYQSILKDLKQSTRQRFVAIEFDYPPPELEAEIVAREGGGKALRVASIDAARLRRTATACASGDGEDSSRHMRESFIGSPGTARTENLHDVVLPSQMIFIPVIRPALSRSIVAISDDIAWS